MKTHHRTVAGLALSGLLVLGGTGMSIAATDRLNAQDRLFLRSAHQGHRAEISAARIAAHTSRTTAVRELAARWITDHTALDRAVTQAAVALGVPLPAAVDGAQEAVEARYETASVEEFDALWVSTQITAHHRASALVDAELAVGSSASVRTLARAAQPVIATHHRLLADAASSAGAVVPVEADAPRPGAVRTAMPTVSTAPTPGWRVTESPGAPGWTLPSAGASGPIPIPGGPGPSITVGSR